MTIAAIRLYTTHEAAEALHVSYYWLSRQIREYSVPCIRVLGIVRLREADLTVIREMHRTRLADAVQRHRARLDRT